MSLLDDPALRLAVPPPQAAPEGWGKVMNVRVRFRPSSTFVRKFDLPEGATGLVTGTYQQNDRKLAWVTIDTPTGPLYATGVRVDEMERA
jgi:hypothetical protein